MRIFEVEQKEKGTYAGVYFSEETKNAIMKFIKDNNIPNAPKRDLLHCTLLYSKKHCPDYKAQGKIDPPMTGTPDGYTIWKSQPDDNGNKTNCLILKFTCQELTDRHNYLMKTHDATFDYDTYKTHVTLSYDVGDLKTKDLPQFEGQLEIVEEYHEELNVSWAINNTK